MVADLNEPSSLDAAFASIEKVFLLTPGIGLEHTTNSLAAARRAGVKHVVHLSSYAVLGNPIPAMGRWHHEREELVAASGIPATILRPGGFMTNALDWAQSIRGHGYVLDPIGPGRYAPIDPIDIAAVAALVLTTDGHQDSRYALTGEETFTVAEQVGIIAQTIGCSIDVREPRTPEEAVRARFPNGAPQPLAEAIIEGFALMRADTTGFRTDTVRKLLGRSPRTFADWCARHADAFLPA